MESDQDINIHFVQTVQTYPCLYDYSTKDYSNRNAQDKAWREIGKKFDTTFTKCKERWKNLRGCYTRHLKAKSASGFDIKLKNAYYLAEYLNFLEPFTKSRKRTGRTISVPLASNNNCNYREECSRNVSEDDHKISDTKNIMKDIFGISNLDNSNQSFTKHDSLTTSQSTSTITKSTIKNERHSVSLEDVNKAVFDPSSQKKINPIEEDADLYFFKSLLPDMKLMNPEQKRHFKIGVLNLSENILNYKISPMT